MIRRMEARDLAVVLSIQKASPELAQWKIWDYERVITGEMAGWVAEDGKSLIGFVVARQILDEVEILNIAVAPDARRRKAGTQLLRAAFEWARANGGRRVFLETRVSNGGAIAFYQIHGFHEIGRRAKYYLSPVEDAIVLAMNLE